MRYRFSITPGDWVQVERALNLLSRAILTQSLTTTSTPEFAGLTLTGFSGVLKATAGVLGGSATHNDLGGVSANQHHNQAHVLNSSDHTVSGLTPGHVLQATGATTFGFAAIGGLLPAETDPVAMGYIDQSVKQAASPTFAGLTLTGFSGLLKATAGVVGTITDNSTAWNAAQPGHANLTSLSGLTFASTSFVKMTAAGTFGLDTATYLTSFTETDPVVKAINGIVKSNGSTISAAVAGTDYQSGTLTATRIPYATGSPGTLTDSAALTFDGTNVIGTGYARFDGGIGIGAAPTTSIPIIIQYVPSISSTNVKGIQMSFASGYIGTSVTGRIYGIDFSPSWSPTNPTANRSFGTFGLGYGMVGGNAQVNYSTSSVTNGYTFTLGAATGFQAQIVVSGNTFGATTLTNAYAFLARNAITSNSTITNSYSFYDAGQTSATNNWGIGINTANNYINGSLRIGSAVAPTVALDVTGAALISTTLGVTGLITATGGLTYPTHIDNAVLFTDSTGLVSSDADMTFATDTLTVTKLVIGTSLTTVGGTAPVADGTYTVGARLTPVTGTDGTITTKSGIITAVTPAT
jgi:hypothetical protein